MSEIALESILLEPEQEELLVTVVEAARNTPREERRKFLVARTMSGDFLIHPGVPADKRSVYYGDVETLGRQGLVAISFGSRGSPNFDVTPLGFRYYEYLKKKMGKPVQRVEATVRHYLDADEFASKYPEAFAKWSSAEDLLWQTGTQDQLTTIGHLCREAAQLFTTSLVECFDPPSVTTDVAKTVARLRAVLNTKASDLGKTEKAFLDALLAYWGTVNDLIQRQEHGAQKEGEELVWEDGRRVVFQTAIIMFEIDKAL